MEPTELIEIISRGEDSRNQFKADVRNEVSLGQEMAAFSNSGGGRIYIGVSDDASVSGLSIADIGRLNQLISNAASQQIRPPINPITENISHPDGLVVVVSIPSGISKPYMDKDGIIWIKSGADKRKATSREEIQRIFQAAGLIHGDEVPANGMSVADIDKEFFSEFFQKRYEERLEDQKISLSQITDNLNLSKSGQLNVAGALLFSRDPSLRLPAFIIKCVSYPGTDIHASEYRDSEDITGNLKKSFDRAVSFISRNIRHIQNTGNINSLGQPEIPKTVLEELLVNALIHRDYFISAPVRIFIFDDRIEIISPGHLPNNLTIEHIKAGNSNIRNPVLASFATKILPYRGLGTGISRSLKLYPDIDFFDDREGSLFRAVIQRIRT